MPQLRGHKGDRYLSWFTSCLAPPLGSLENTELLSRLGGGCSWGCCFFRGPTGVADPDCMETQAAPGAVTCPSAEKTGGGNPIPRKTHQEVCFVCWCGMQPKSWGNDGRFLNTVCIKRCVQYWIGNRKRCQNVSSP